MSQDKNNYYRAEVAEPNEVTQALVDHAERSLGSILRRLSFNQGLEAPSIARLDVFDSAWAYQDHLSRVLGPGAGQGSAGMFYACEDQTPAISLFIREMPVFDLMATIQHECFHHAAFLVFGSSLPRWINEGLAQVFQDAIHYSGRMNLGMANPDRLERLQESTSRAGIQELIETPDEAWFASPDQYTMHISRLYESAWLIALTLIQGPSPELRHAFGRYLGLLRMDKVDHERAWRLAMHSIPFQAIDEAADKFLDNFDPPIVSTAIHKMSLLSMIFGSLNGENLRMPKTLDEARNRMRMLGVEVRRRVPGSEPIRYRADDERLYTYEIEDGLCTEFELEPSTYRRHPPILRAPGVMGEPAVRWVGRGRRVVPWIELDA